MIEDRSERIRQRAYIIWQREGRPEGREQEQWRQAEAEIEAEDVAGGETPPNDVGPGGIVPPKSVRKRRGSNRLRRGTLVEANALPRSRETCLCRFQSRR
ncbi:hypothetical protein QFZ27_001587 [Inquilinus ginsengisoli]|jgi:hypothetical protein|uniref:DUF2934 domain-containing protein n=1 Tax=Inquilinus ginsengisoli TaxID=363840 RepID=UPI003D20DDD1